MPQFNTGEAGARFVQTATPPPPRVDLFQDARAAEQARAAGVERLFATGELSRQAVRVFGKGARHFPDRAALTSALVAVLGDVGTPVHLLVKGSRGIQLERVVDALVERFGGGVA